MLCKNRIWNNPLIGIFMVVSVLNYVLEPTVAHAGSQGSTKQEVKAGRFHPLGKKLLKNLGYENAEEKIKALRQGEKYSAEEVALIKELVQLLKSPDKKVFKAACSILQEVDGDMLEVCGAIPVLVEQLKKRKDKESSVCWLAKVLVKVGERARAALPVLRDLRERENSLIAIHANAALVAVAEKQADYVSSLAGHLDTEEDVKHVVWVIWWFDRLGDKVAGAVPQMIDFWQKSHKSENEVTRRLARYVAGRLLDIGEPADEIVPVLLTFYSDLKDASDRAMLIRHLGKFKGQKKSIYDALLPVAKHARPEMKAACLDLIGQLGAESKEVRNQVLRHVKSEHPEVRAAAVGTCGGLGFRFERLYEELKEALDDKACKVRRSAVETLTEAEGPCGKKVEILVNALADEECRLLRKYAARKLAERDCHKERIVQKMVERLSSEGSWLVVETIARSLGEIGCEGKEALPALRKELEEADAPRVLRPDKGPPGNPRAAEAIREAIERLEKE